jgi:serine phosphatase RsbU (regulator of sigma subunit)
MMFTDGVTDALNPQGEQFGEKQLFSLLQQPIVSVKDLLDQVVEHLQAHIAEADQFDDITMLAARRNPIPD